MCEYISMEVLEISIHVPTRGTTPSTVLNYTVDRFQSTCPRGARLLLLPLIDIDIRFQSTCPRGARLRVTGKSFKVIFQSTCPRGARLRVTGKSFKVIFQSTCPRGARLSSVYSYHPPFISIHVPTRGTTQIIARDRYLYNFNPRAHEGHDQLYEGHFLPLLFQSTCPRGARRGCDA